MRTRHQKVLFIFEPKDLMAPKALTVSHEGLPSMVSAAVGTSDLGGWVSGRAEAGGSARPTCDISISWQQNTKKQASCTVS